MSRAREVLNKNALEIEAAKDDYRALTAIAKEAGIDSTSGFSAYKKALLAIGIDYNALRDSAKSEKVQSAQSLVEGVMTLYSDAASSTNRFCVANADGEAVWYGEFYNTWIGEQSAAEMEAAKKAVYLASRARKGEHTIALTLYVDAQWLCWANQVFENPSDRKTGGKARALGEYAIKLGVVLNVQHVRGEDNPADKMTRSRGYAKMPQGADLEALLASQVDAR